MRERRKPSPVASTPAATAKPPARALPTAEQAKSAAQRALGFGGAAAGSAPPPEERSAKPAPVQEPQSVDAADEGVDPQGEGPDPELGEAVRKLGMEDGYRRIVDDIFETDEPPEDIFEQVRKGMKLGNRASSADYGSLVDALDQAEELTRLAHLLYVRAVDEYESFERDSEIVESAMRHTAVQQLEREKREKIRTKQITDADVVSTIAGAYPDEYQELAEKKRRARLMVEHMQDLHKRAASRAVHLRTMVRGKQGGFE